jgi:hypothetical protein
MTVRGSRRQRTRERKIIKKTFGLLICDLNPISGERRRRVGAGLLRHPAPTSTNNSEDVRENFLYVFKDGLTISAFHDGVGRRDSPDQDVTRHPI